ncbi:unnamed protein product [Brassica oleracea]
MIVFLAHSFDNKKANIIQKSRKNRAKERWVEDSGKLEKSCKGKVGGR